MQRLQATCDHARKPDREILWWACQTTGNLLCSCGIDQQERFVWRPMAVISLVFLWKELLATGTVLSIKQSGTEQLIVLWCSIHYVLLQDISNAAFHTLALKIIFQVLLNPAMHNKTKCVCHAVAYVHPFRSTEVGGRGYWASESFAVDVLLCSVVVIKGIFFLMSCFHLITHC